MRSKILRRITKATISLFVVAGLLVALAYMMPPSNFEHDPARDLPWSLPNVSLAKTSISYLDDGRINIEIIHAPMADVTPAMIKWFYRHLPISTVKLKSTVYPLYHLFHPTEHGEIWLKEPASDKSVGMGVGALVARQEWFGSFNSKGAGRVVEFSEQGMLFKPEIGGFHLGAIRHSFTSSEEGVRYQLSSIIGSDAPLIGPLINHYIRHKVFTPEMLEQWVRHQVEEVGSLAFFLPALYRVKEMAPNFELTIPAVQLTSDASGMAP